MAEHVKRVQVYETPDVTVTFDPNLCQHTGHLSARTAERVRHP